MGEAAALAQCVALSAAALVIAHSALRWVADHVAAHAEELHLMRRTLALGERNAVAREEEARNDARRIALQERQLALDERQYEDERKADDSEF